MNQINENENKGFSLVELIVVIAIMAVLTSVLAPSLLGYVEKSRMQKDDSAMGEVTNAIKLALADQNVYDECLTYNVTNNFSCYIDKDHQETAPTAAEKSVDKCRGTGASIDHAKDGPCTGDDWHTIDTTRLGDEIAYKLDGNMRGMTLTFYTTPGSNTTVFNLGDAKVNDATDAQTARTLTYKSGTTPAVATLSTMKSTGGQTGQLYNKLRAAIGDTITLSSQTYRNSKYTVFIRMGSMGGNQASAQDAVAVYGQWNGTNL